MVRRKRVESGNGKRWGVIIMMGVMVFLMVASMASVMLYAPLPAGQTEYGELVFEVQQATGFYVTEHEDRLLRFNYLPLNALSVPVDMEAINLIRTAPFFIMTFDPELDEEQLTFIDFVRYELANVYTNIGGAVTQNSSTYPLPVFTCADASVATPVVEIRPASAPAIRKVGECVILEGNLTSMLLVKDAFLYHTLGIILPGDYTLVSSPYSIVSEEDVDSNPLLVDEVLLDGDEA